MSNQKLRGKDLDKINYPTDQAKSMALEIVQKDYKRLPKTEKLNLLEDVLLHANKYLEHASFSKLAELFVGKHDAEHGIAYELREIPENYRVFGGKLILPDCMQQMDMAMRLPISHSGALMPDAHVGYGLPIGGVLAAKNAVIPYGIGLDIGCRMSLSIYELPKNFLKRYAYQIQNALRECTHFGIGKDCHLSNDHAVLEDSAFAATALLKQLHGKARMQLGSSGSGNHFVEFGVVELPGQNQLHLPEGEYLGILAHSGSRGLGAAIANYYLDIAMQKCHLPKGAQHLAWLDLDGEAGEEYWLSMNLAGEYAKACHDVIHENLAKSLGLTCIAKLENHHNFAWKEVLNGQELIVHRKGATPAHNGQMGIIPANMMDAAYLVSGKGNASSLCSASHGAGRRLSRKKAKESITGSELRKRLKQKDICLMGGNVDEAPMAYKNLEEVMHYQKDLVDVEGKFYPRIVRMDRV
ncbi:RtcB family protein [Marinifilum fragile]|uniref:RtcB family protein n=1 Tax=Marinifilum fragile TaxID=570161 RepID=UPI0006CF8EC2|nr:RtcB family protein [Marinifilum fragile]